MMKVTEELMETFKKKLKSFTDNPKADLNILCITQCDMHQLLLHISASNENDETAHVRVAEDGIDIFSEDVSKDDILDTSMYLLIDI